MMQAAKFDRQDYLSKENTNCLKGILAVGVLAHHLYQHSGLLRNGWLHLIGGCFQALGFLTVALFFFLSGYGLIAAYSNNPQSIYHFKKYKIIPFYVINLILIAIYCCMYLLIGKPFTFGLIIQSLTFGGTVIANGWYIQVQLLYYILFYLVFRYCKGKWRIHVMLLSHTAYVALCILFGLSSLYYERTFIFVFGMLWYENKDRIDSWIIDKRNKWLIIWIVLGLIFATNYLLSYLTMPVLFRGISYFFLIPSVLLPLKKVNIQNRLTNFLGNISLEIYVMQGVFLLLFHAEKTYISNPYLYIVAVTASTIASACILHPLIKYVYHSFRKL